MFQISGCKLIPLFKSRDEHICGTTHQGLSNPAGIDVMALGFLPSSFLDHPPPFAMMSLQCGVRVGLSGFRGRVGPQWLACLIVHELGSGVEEKR